jgi:hypothetical protein
LPFACFYPRFPLHPPPLPCKLIGIANYFAKQSVAPDAEPLTPLEVATGIIMALAIVLMAWGAWMIGMKS